MKALVLTGKNRPLIMEERTDLVPDTGQAVVRVHAAALNHRDLWIQKGQYAGLKYPIIPGADGAGVVTAVGAPAPAEGSLTTAIAPSASTADGDPASWQGKEVIINPAQQWGSYPSHQDQKDFRILGLPDDGTFAEYVKVPVSSLVERPQHLSFEEAAAIPLAGVTAYRAVFTRGQVQTGMKVLVTGIGGGVALFALQYAVAAGARVYVTSGSDAKLEKALALGAAGGVNYTHPDWGHSLQTLAGAFDVVIDGAAGDGMNELLNLAAPGSKLVFYGATRGNPSELITRRIFWKQLDVLGSTMGSPEDFQAMIGFIGRHKIRPVVDKIFPFAEGQAALQWMDEASQFGKIVIKIHTGSGDH